MDASQINEDEAGKSADAPDIAKIAFLLRECRSVIEMAREALAGPVAVLEAVQRDLEATVEPGFNLPSTDLPPASQHRREHRAGVPAKIDNDPELQAFIAARCDRMSFPQLAREVAEHFSPARRVGKTAIHDWWHRSGKAKRARGGR